MSSSKLVYSTDRTTLYPAKIISSTSGIKKDVPITISRLLNGRKGKGVTRLSGFQLSRIELKKLVKHLKQECCSGGTIKKGNIEIQGDKREKAVQLLTEMGFSTIQVGS
jgi:translation initiation factor 1